MLQLSQHDLKSMFFFCNNKGSLTLDIVKVALTPLPLFGQCQKLSVFFYVLAFCEMVGLTNFGLDIGVCTVNNVMIQIKKKKIFLKLLQDLF